MNCPYCGNKMKSGRIDTKAVLYLTRHPASVIFEPHDYPNKKKTSSPLAKWEGWYCDECKKIVGIFDANR